MTNEAKKEIERRENLAANFISQYNEKRATLEDPTLRLGYAVSELLQIVIWLRIEIDKIEKMIQSNITICKCGHHQNIHTAGIGVCCSHDGESFDCDCHNFRAK